LLLNQVKIRFNHHDYSLFFVIQSNSLSCRNRHAEVFYTEIIIICSISLMNILPSLFIFKPTFIDKRIFSAECYCCIIYFLTFFIIFCEFQKYYLSLYCIRNNTCPSWMRNAKILTTFRGGFILSTFNFPQTKP